MNLNSLESTTTMFSFGINIVSRRREDPCLLYHIVILNKHTRQIVDLASSSGSSLPRASSPLRLVGVNEQNNSWKLSAWACCCSMLVSPVLWESFFSDRPISFENSHFLQLAIITSIFPACVIGTTVVSALVRLSEKKRTALAIDTSLFLANATLSADRLMSVASAVRLTSAYRQIK